MVIPLTLDEAEGGGSLCLEAEVLQGDTRVDDKRVTVSLEPGSSPGSSRAHVRSTVAIDEPVVTVTLRAGCDTKSTRRFVLFADLPIDTAAVAAAPAPATEGPRPAPPPFARSGDVSPGGGAASGDSEFVPQPPPRRAPPPPRVARPPRAEPPTRPAAVPPPPRARVAAAPPVVRPPAPPPAPRVAAPAPAAAAPAPAPAARSESSAGGSRLQIDALEPTPGRPGELKSSQTLALPGTEDAAKRADAAAAWRAIATAPEEAQRDAQRLQSLEATLNALREQTAQNERTLLALRSDLTEARESRYRNPLVYALIALLLLALLALALMWRALRRATAPAWWRDEPEAPPALNSKSVPLEGAPGPDRPIAPPVVHAPGSTFAPAEPEEDEEERLVTPPVAPIRAALSHPAQRLVNTEELYDVQQQSDFFLSLGQHDQAIAVLRDHIASSPGTSALAYLDLLNIYHSQNRKQDYDRLRQDFQRTFNAGVPEFEHFDEAGRGLEYYENALARIEAQWPTPATLPLIEELVFRKPGGHEDEAVDLAAYRELLLLYSVAKEVIDPNSAPPAPVTPLSYADTHFHPPLTAAPVAAAAATATATATAAALALDEQTTDPAPLGPDNEVLSGDTAPAPLDTGPTLSGSLYGEVDDDSLGEQTVMSPDVMPAEGRTEPPPPRPGRDLDFSDVDRTAYETLPSPLEESARAPASANDPNSIDFELFDPDTEAEIAPRKPKG